MTATIEQALAAAVAAALADALAPLVRVIDDLSDHPIRREVLTADEAATILGVSPSIVYRWVKDGHLANIAPGTANARTVRIPYKSVISFVDEAHERSLARRRMNGTAK